MTATNGASVCGRVGVLCGRLLNTTRDNANPLPLKFKSARAVHQRYNTSEHRNAHTHRNACFPPFQFAAPTAFQVNHIPKGDLVPGTICTTYDSRVTLQRWKSMCYFTALITPVQALGVGMRTPVQEYQKVYRCDGVELFTHRHRSPYQVVFMLYRTRFLRLTPPAQ